MNLITMLPDGNFMFTVYNYLHFYKAKLHNTPFTCNTWTIKENIVQKMSLLLPNGRQPDRWGGASLNSCPVWIVSIYVFIKTFTHLKKEQRIGLKAFLYSQQGFSETPRHVMTCLRMVAYVKCHSSDNTSLALLSICPTSCEENWLANFECKNIQSITSQFFFVFFSFSERHELNPIDLWTIPSRMVHESGVTTYIWVQQQEKKCIFCCV